MDAYKYQIQVDPLIQNRLKRFTLMSKIKFGYWHIRGLGQTPRLLAAYTGIQLDETRYTDREKWLNEDKQNLGFDFPNLPYLIDGDFKLTKSAAINRYIIQKSGHDELLARVDSILGTLKDAMKDIRGLFWNKDWQNAKGAALQKGRAKLNDIQNFVGDKKWAIGYLTLADFEIAEFSFYFEKIYPQQYNNWSFFETIRENFHALPEIEAYYKSENAFVEPFLPPQMAALQPTFRATLVLGYWGLRGLGQQLRLLLSYSGLPFEQKVYTSREQWFEKDKPTISTPFPNIPYLKDGQFVLTESAAIERYIARRSHKTELLGKNLQDTAKHESLLGVHWDILTELQKNFWVKDEQQLKKSTELIDTKLGLLDKFYGERSTAFEYLTIVDFLLGERSYYIEAVSVDIYKKHQFLHRVRNHINELESTKAYYARENAIKAPFMPPTSLIQPSE